MCHKLDEISAASVEPSADFSAYRNQDGFTGSQSEGDASDPTNNLSGEHGLSSDNMEELCTDTIEKDPELQCTVCYVYCLLISFPN